MQPSFSLHRNIILLYGLLHQIQKGYPVVHFVYPSFYKNASKTPPYYQILETTL